MTISRVLSTKKSHCQPTHRQSFKTALRSGTPRSRLRNPVMAQLAREIELTLPVELSIAAQLALVRSYVQDNFIAAGMCADFVLHDKSDGNPHTHIMLTIRPLHPDGIARYDLNNHFNIIFSVTVLSVFDSTRFSPAGTPEPGRYLPRQTPPSGFFPGKSAVPKCAVPAHPAC